MFLSSQYTVPRRIETTVGIGLMMMMVLLMMMIASKTRVLWLNSAAA